MKRLLHALPRLRDRLLPADWRGLRWLLAAHLVLQLSGIAWDLPASFEWEGDAVAPRDFFAGIALNLPPGPGHTYPLLHNLILGLVNLPTLLVSVACAPSWQPGAVMRHVLGYGTMTVVYLTCKLVSVLMNLVALAALARVVGRLWQRDAGLWAAAWAAVNLSVAYYGRATNLDGPYLMWMALAADRLLDVIETGTVRDYRMFALLVAASVATKDQAYAAWVLPGPVLLVLWPALRPAALAAGAQHWRRLAAAIGGGALGLGVLGGGLLNPPGLWNRVHGLMGHASQDWRTYEASLAGVLRNVHDLLWSLPADWWPLPVLALLVLGLGVAARTATVPRALPLLLGLSFLACFTLVVARVGQRFALPTGFWMAAYLGVGSAWLTQKFAKNAQFALALLWLLALGHTLTVQVAQWTDSRRPVEAWLAQLPPGTRIRIAGGVSQPRFGRDRLAHLRVSRLGVEAVDHRNPLLGVEEIQGDWHRLLGDKPDAVVVPAGLVNAYQPDVAREGSRLPAVLERQKAEDGSDAFWAIARGQAPGYRTYLIPTQWPTVLQRLGVPIPHVHASIGEDQMVLMRTESALPPLHGTWRLVAPRD